MVSVIVPVLNNEKYLDECISSVIQQTYQDFELLLMVGRCRDRSLEKCLEWQRRDERIIVVSRKDTSLGDARNYALPITKGDYIAYLDADDTLEEDHLEKMVAILEQHTDVDFVCCGYSMYKDGKFVKECLPDAQGPYEVDFESYLHLGVFVMVWTKMYRTSFLKENGITMFDGMMEDVSLDYILASMVRKIYVIRQPLYRYTMDNEGGLVNSREYESRMGYVKAVDFVIDYMNKHGVYEANRKLLQEIVCGHMYFFLVKYDFDKKLMNAYTSFIKDNFPDMLGIIRFSRREMMDREFVMYGAGREARRVMRFKPDDVKIRYVVDSKQDKVGTSIEKVPIKNVEVLKNENKEVPILISSTRYRFEIELELRRQGFNNVYYIEDILTDEQLKVRM